MMLAWKGPAPVGGFRRSVDAIVRVLVVVSAVMGRPHARVLLRPIAGAAPRRQSARWFTRFDSSAALSRRSL